MFGTIRKHQTWLWAIIITLTIISFVIFFSPVSKVHNDRGEGNFGSINGERISKVDYENAQREVYLQYFFMSSGNWLNEQEARRTGFDPDQRTYIRLLMLQQEEKLGIHVGSDVAAQYATEMLRPFERANINSPQQFVTQVLKPRGLSVEDFDRFVRHELGIQELISTVGLSGRLITPQEAQSLYVREHEELATEAVFFSATNYLSKVSVTPEAISQFYTNKLPDYRIPDRVQVSYVKFGFSNAMAKVEKDLTNLTEIVESNFQRLGTNYTRIASTPAEAKVRIREELLMRPALPEVRREAGEFSGPLFEMTPARPENLDVEAKKKGLAVNVSAPFTREEGPKELEVGPEFAKSAFALTPEEPFAQIIGRDGIYVIALNKKIPSEVPSLDSIRDRVTADYKLAQSTLLARKAGADFSAGLTNALAQGKTFAAVVADAKLKAVELPPFSISTREIPQTEDHIPADRLKQIAFSTPVGQVSAFSPTAEGGMILHVKSKLPLDETKMKTDLPNFLAYVRQTRQREAFDTWFRKEVDKGLRDTPLIKQQQQPPAMSGTAKS